MTTSECFLRELSEEDDTESFSNLRANLVGRAYSDNLVDVVYRTIDSPVGGLLLAATPNGLVRVAFEIEGHERVLAQLSDRVSPRILRSPAHLDVVAFQIDEYFARSRHQFDLQLDLQLAHGFRRRVLNQLRDIAYGKTATYADVANAAGSPRAVRAVGSACATNPLPLVVPCHRVVRSDGTVGGYGGGPATKTALLSLESSK